MKCDYCRKNTEGFAHRCKYCGQIHCAEHLVPENHNCRGLPKQTWRHLQNQPTKVINFPKQIKEDKPKENKEKSKQKTLSERLKDYLIKKYEYFKYWLNKREHYSYDFKTRINYLITTIVIFAVSLVIFFLSYSNFSKLNAINLWIIKLAGVLLLISLYFIIKYGWRFIKEMHNLIKRQKNWLKYLIIILILILLWQGYIHRDSAFRIYHETKFILFVPVDFNKISLNNNYNEYVQSNEKKPLSDSFEYNIDIVSLENSIHNFINIERGRNGLKSLSIDSKLSSIARYHSIDMAQNNFFSHNNLKGQDPTDRAKEKGYTCYKNYGTYYTDGIAENIFQNNLYSSITYIYAIPIYNWNSESEIAFSTVQGWMNSPGHRQNILTATYDVEGIGVAISQDKKVYITQDFC